MRFVCIRLDCHSSFPAPSATRGPCSPCSCVGRTCPSCAPPSVALTPGRRAGALVSPPISPAVAASPCPPDTSACSTVLPPGVHAPPQASGPCGLLSEATGQAPVGSCPQKPHPTPDSVFSISTYRLARRAEHLTCCLSPRHEGPARGQTFLRRPLHSCTLVPDTHWGATRVPDG